MRPGNNNNNRRGRNRGPRKPHSGGMPNNKNQNFDGGGSDTRVRGNVYQVLEKYLQLARDAGVAGDRVAAENFLQHADHYYRVITTMNDGQRPRVGGREISVADVNVQNVSQGLSAALYSGGPSQPNMSDGGNGPAPQQGNAHAGNGHGDNGQNENGRNDSGQGDGNRGDSNRGDNSRGDNRRNNNQHAGDNQARSGNAADDQGDDAGNGGEYVPPQRNNRGRNNNTGGRNTGPYDRNATDTRNGDTRNGDTRNGQAGNAPVQEAIVREQPVAPVPVSIPVSIPAPAQINDKQSAPDEQPDYPEHLLPPAAASAETPAEGARAPRGAPRGRLRTRRPRQGAEGEGEAVADTTAPATEGSE